MRADMEGFALLGDGELVLMDECGRYVFCDSSRFDVKFVTGFRVEGEPIPVDTDPEAYRALVANLDAEGVGGRAQQVQFLIDKAVGLDSALTGAVSDFFGFVEKLYEVRMEPDKLIILIQLAKQEIVRAKAKRAPLINEAFSLLKKPT